MRRTALAFLLATAAAQAAPDYGSAKALIDGVATTGIVRMVPTVVGYKDIYGSSCPDRSKPLTGAPPAGKPVQLRFDINMPEGGPNAANVSVQLGGYTPEELAKTPLTIAVSPKRLKCPEKHLLMQWLGLQQNLNAEQGKLTLESVDLASGKFKGRFEFSGTKTTLMSGEKKGLLKIVDGQFDVHR